jgi:hypothetical protein
MKAQEFIIGKPIGGVNTRTYPTEIANEEFVMLKNVDPFQHVGAFVTRGGTDAFNTTLPVESKPVRGGYRFYYSTTRDLLMIAGTAFFKKTGGAGSFTNISAQTGISVTEHRDWFFASYLNRCYMANGIDSMKRWDPTASADTFKAAGFPGVIAVGMTPATGVAGALTGTYYYAVSQTYDSNTAHESSGFISSTSVAPVAQKVNLTGIPTGGSGRFLYRTEANAGIAGPYYLVTTLNASDTTYTDNLADASLGDEMPTDNGIPPAGQFVVFWRGRMVVAKTVAQPQRVYFSAIATSENSPAGDVTVHGADVEIFPASHYMDIGDDNSPITGLAVMQDQLVVFKENQIWNITGDDAEDFRLWKSQATTGCIAAKTIVNVRGTLLFLGRNEGMPAVYSYDGSSIDCLSLSIEPTLVENVRDLGDIANQTIQPCATLYRGCYLMSYQKTGSSGFEVAVLDTRPPRPRWLFFDGVEASVFIPFNGPGDAGDLYYGSAAEARVLKLNSGLTNFHATTPTAIAMEIETGWMDLDAPYHIKQINWIDIYGREGDEPDAPEERDPGVTTITVERMYDFDLGGTILGCDEVDVTEADKHMDRQLWKHRIHCEGSDGEVPEICYRMKLLITTSAPMEIHRIVINYTPSTPEDTHGQE